MMYELRKELMDKIKICTGHLFSEKTYESIMSNEDISIDTLFADKEFQLKSIDEISSIEPSLNSKLLEEVLVEQNISISWLEIKIDILKKFEMQLQLMVQDFASDKSTFNQNLNFVYEMNKDKIKMSKDKFITNMNNIPNQMPMRVLNVIYLDKNFIATQSFDSTNIELFYN